MVWRSRSQRRGRGSCAGGRQLADPSLALDGELDSLDATQDSVEGTSRKLCERYAKAPVVAASAGAGAGAGGGESDGDGRSLSLVMVHDTGSNK